MPDGLLMLRNCFLDFAVEQWFGCRATEPGFAGDIGPSLIDGLIDWSFRNYGVVFSPSYPVALEWITLYSKREFYVIFKITRPQGKSSND